MLLPLTVHCSQSPLPQRGHRPGDTPVGIVGDAFRPGQRVKITSLQGLEKEAESVDMVTIVVIGNSTTYLHAGKVITPRGYEEKTKSS